MGGVRQSPLTCSASFFILPVFYNCQCASTSCEPGVGLCQFTILVTSICDNSNSIT